MARTKKAHFSQMAQKAKYLAAMSWLSIYSDQVNIEQFSCVVFTDYMGTNFYLTWPHLAYVFFNL